MIIPKRFSTYSLLYLFFLFVCMSIFIAEQANEHYNRRSMVRLGVRVIHKISSETKAQPIIEPTSNNLSKSLRSRLSPKALKLANKFSTSVDENQHRRLHKCSESGGSMPRIDIENNSIEMKIRQSKVRIKLLFIIIYSNKKKKEIDIDDTMI